MYRLSLKYLCYILVIYILSFIIDTIRVDYELSILILGFVLLLVNMIIKPLLLIITLPFSIITFGLFSLVVNAWTIMLADFFVPSIELNGFFNALIAGACIVILNHTIFKPTRKDKILYVKI